MTPLALSSGELVREVGVVAAALAAAGAFFLPGARARAAAVLCVLVLAPALLAAEVWTTPPLLYLRSAPLLALGALTVGGAVLAALAAVLLRRPAWLAPLALAALPFRVPVVAAGQTANLLVPLYLVVGAGGLAYAWARLRPRGPSDPVPRDRPAGRVEVALLGAVLLYAVQASYSTDFAQALENVIFFYLPFALLLKLLSGLDWTPGQLRRCLAVLVVLALAFVLVGFVEYATGRLLLNPKVIASNQFESFFRVNSLFFDPNIYGRFLAVVMLAVTGALLWSRRTRTMLTAAGVLAVLWAGLVLTFSQSSFAALLVGLAVLAAVRWGPRPVALAGGGAALVAVLVVLAAPGLLRLDLGSADALDQATSGRIGLMGGGLSLWGERPVLGHGSGSFSERFRDREEASSETAVAASHTIPITVGAEQGVVGLAVYLILLGAAATVLVRGLSGLRDRGPPTVDAVGRAVAAAAFAALFVHTLLYAAFLEDPLSWAILAAALGLGAGSLPTDGPVARSAPSAPSDAARAPAAAPAHSGASGRR
ncbi:MAG: O-antigen ligase family protein [Thermoleophilaceae bacterium]